MRKLPNIIEQSKTPGYGEREHCPRTHHEELDPRDATVPDSGAHKLLFVRNGFKAEVCTGEAHSNAMIDNCTLCAPNWGVRAVRLVAMLALTMLALTLGACSLHIEAGLDTSATPAGVPSSCLDYTPQEFRTNELACAPSAPTCGFDVENWPTPLNSERLSYYCECDGGRYYCWSSPSLAHLGGWGPPAGSVPAQSEPQP